MYFDRRHVRGNRSNSSYSFCKCSMPPIRYLIITIFIFVLLLYISSMISKSWCDHEKDIISGQSNRQLELELTKLRQCIETKATIHEKSNDLQWEIEKFKRSNSELQDDNKKLNDQVTEYKSKYETSLQEIQKLKVEIEQLNEKHSNIQQAIHNQIGQDGPKIIEHVDNSDKAIIITQPPPQNIDNHVDNDISPFGRNGVSVESAKIGIAVVIFCYNRHSYLERTLESVFTYLPPAGFSVFISQQGSDPDVTKIIEKYTIKSGKAYWLGFDYNKTPQKIQRGFEEKRWKVYHKISAHYKYAFQYLFDKLNYDKVISLEDDMEISSDFFSYFQNLGKLMDTDLSIFCVSAWNDYGQRELVYDSKGIYRTDIFPGLGWMFNQKIWNEFSINWPLAFWDDWLRESKQRKNRSCLRPEINRVYTFGSSGSSEGLFYNKYLRTIELNKDDIDWSTDYIYNEIINNLSPIENYDKYLKSIIEQSQEITIDQVLNLEKQPMKQPLDYIIKYHDLSDYTIKSKKLNLMDDHKDGLPRQSYRGIVVVRWKNNRILFVPNHHDIDIWEPRTFHE